MACFIRMVDKKEMGRATGNYCSNHTIKSNPVFPVEPFHGTKHLLEGFEWVRLGYCLRN